MEQSAPTQAGAMKPGLYPTLRLDHIQDPNRLWAIPIIGGLCKIIILIPAFIFYILVLLIAGIALLINSMVVLFTGTYWQPAYELTLGTMRYGAKLTLFWYGLLNEYPGFDLQTKGILSVTMPMPENPNRLFAIPFFGGIVRSILLIPYFIYTYVLNNGASLGTLISSFVILATGRYPESTYEFGRDSIRVTGAASAYMAGFSDTYPSWWISMNHKTIKILLIIAGVLLSFNNMSNSSSSNTTTITPNDMMYNEQMVDQDTQMQLEDMQRQLEQQTQGTDSILYEDIPADQSTQ